MMNPLSALDPGIDAAEAAIASLLDAFGLDEASTPPAPPAA